MNNALVKQRESIEHVDAIIEGIHKVDDKKVMDGLKGLSNIDFSEIETPLSPFFDLVTGISHGREDFLSLERKHLLALVIRDMAQAVYQWAQASNKGVAHVTKGELTTRLEKLIELLEPKKDPCISAITNLTCAKAIASCLVMSDSDTNEWWDRLIFVGELIGYSLQFAAGITTARIDTGFQAALSILQRLYKSGVLMREMLEAKNEQALVMQIVAVNAWKEMLYADSSLRKPNKEQVEKQIKEMLEGIEQYLKEGSDQKSTERKSKEEKGAIAKLDLMRANPTSKKSLIKEALSENINVLKKDLLADPTAGQYDKMIEALREVAFHALVDLYVETARGSVQCEILKVFGALARGLYGKDSLSAERLSSLIKTNKINTVEEAAFRILVEAVCPTVFEQKNQNKSVALSLTSERAVELSKKWKIRCMAIEELLRFEDHYLPKRSKSDKKTPAPIRSFLDEMGREYQVTVLFINKFKLDEGEIASLRDFLHHAKRMGEARKLLRKALPFREAAVDKLLKKDKDAVKEFLAFNSEFTEGEIEALLRKEENALVTLKVRLAQKLNLNLNMELSDSDIGLISDILRGEVSQKELAALATKEKSIKEWLGKKLNLQDLECYTLIDFLKKDKGQQDQSEQEKYSDEPVRPVLNKLIDQFMLTQAEKDLIDKAIFRGETKHPTQASMIEKVGEAFKSFFGQDNYSNIACAFNNLDRIKKMIEVEKQLVGK